MSAIISSFLPTFQVHSDGVELTSNKTSYSLRLSNFSTNLSKLKSLPKITSLLFFNSIAAASCSHYKEEYLTTYYLVDAPSVVEQSASSQTLPPFKVLSSSSMSRIQNLAYDECGYTLTLEKVDGVYQAIDTCLCTEDVMSGAGDPPRYLYTAATVELLGSNSMNTTVKNCVIQLFNFCAAKNTDSTNNDTALYSTLGAFAGLAVFICLIICHNKRNEQNRRNEIAPVEGDYQLLERR